MIEVFKILHGYYNPDGVPYLKPSSYTSTRGNDKRLFKLDSGFDVRNIQFHCSCCVKHNNNVGL